MMWLVRYEKAVVSMIVTNAVLSYSYELVGIVDCVDRDCVHYFYFVQN